MKPGDLARVKISGETVLVVRKSGWLDGLDFVVMRFNTGENKYHFEYFLEDALETVEQNIDREFAEVVYRQKLMRSKLDEDAEIDFAVDEGQVQ